VAGRAVRLIADVDRDGVSGLAARLGLSERHLHRVLAAETGAGPVALARAQRGQSARALIESTDLPFAEVALAAGFRSVRQFNDTVRAVYAQTPTELRRLAGGRRKGTSAGAIELRLPYRKPFDGEALIAFLRARAVPGLESVAGSTYRRVLSLSRGGGVVELTPQGGAVLCRLRLDDLADLPAAVARCRRLLDLDCDPGAVVAHLESDPVLGALVRRRPGLRVPGCVDGFELAVRAIVGQQVSVAGARTILGRLVARYGDAVRGFPTPATLARVDPATLPFPHARGEALRSVARLVAGGELALDAGADPRQVRATLLGIRGIGPWTASYIAMRALGDPDAWLPGDVGIRHALGRLGQPTDAPRVAEAWRPWRSYAVMHLWTELGIEPQRPIARSASG
jgi:AraC family transcriptional regulator, regulatory protein of adaptative response / DNA-3-methyladenine glycosylase II